MERHDTHLLSCSSSVEHSYKFDKNGNIISDSVSEMPYSKITNKKKYKINTADIFNNINKNTKISQEENINQDNNMNSKEIKIRPFGRFFLLIFLQTQPIFYYYRIHGRKDHHIFCKCCRGIR